MYTQRYKPESIKKAICPECKGTSFLYSKGKVVCQNCGEVLGKTYNKYGAKKTTYNNHKYDSKYEASVAEDLDLRLRVGEVKEVQRQIKIPLEAYGKHIFNYYIDFIAIHNDGHKEYIEAKGQETDLWKAKWKMLEAKLATEEPASEMTLLKQGKIPQRKMFK